MTHKIVHDGTITPIGGTSFSLPNRTLDKNYPINTIFSVNLVPTFSTPGSTSLLPSPTRLVPTSRRSETAWAKSTWVGSGTSGGWDNALASSASSPANNGVVLFASAFVRLTDQDSVSAVRSQASSFSWWDSSSVSMGSSGVTGVCAFTRFRRLWPGAERDVYIDLASDWPDNQDFPLPEAEAIVFLLRLVIDTNILISAAIKPAGLQRTVLLLAITRPARLYVSRPILEEDSEVFGRPGTANSQGSQAAIAAAHQKPQLYRRSDPPPGCHKRLRRQHVPWMCRCCPSGLSGHGQSEALVTSQFPKAEGAPCRPRGSDSRIKAVESGEREFRTTNWFGITLASLSKRPLQHRSSGVQRPLSLQ